MKVKVYKNVSKQSLQTTDHGINFLTNFCHYGVQESILAWL